MHLQYNRLQILQLNKLFRIEIRCNTLGEDRMHLQYNRLQILQLNKLFRIEIRCNTLGIAPDAIAMDVN